MQYLIKRLTDFAEIWYDDAYYIYPSQADDDAVSLWSR